jgi:hypothetical protein
MARENLRQPNRTKPRMASREPKNLRVRQDGIHRELQVRLLSQRNLCPGARQLLGVNTKMLTQPHSHLRLGVLGSKSHRPHEVLKRAPKRPKIRKVTHDHRP